MSKSSRRIKWAATMVVASSETLDVAQSAMNSVYNMKRVHDIRLDGSVRHAVWVATRASILTEAGFREVK